LFIFCSPKKRTKKDLKAFEIQLAVFLVPRTARLTPHASRLPPDAQCQKLLILLKSELCNQEEQNKKVAVQKNSIFYYFGKKIRNCC
jgi:hypothetical protein